MEIKNIGKKSNIQLVKGISEKNIIFCLGMLLGGVIFLLVFGVKVLDFMHDGWIFKSNMDLQQHYLGFMAYRQSPWSFPLGMTDRLSEPFEMSIVYTDSIPLLALIFKACSFLLPDTFQYFGIFALSSYMLTGGFAARIIWKFIADREDWVFRIIYPLCFSMFFTMSFIFMRRTFYHTSLTAQWLLLWAIELWFDGLAERKLSERMKVYALAGLLCTGIHLYFFPMVLAIFCASQLESLIRELNKKRVIETLILTGSMCVSGVLFLAVMGAFGTVSGTKYWIGDFTMNLNSFINPLGKCRFLPELPLLGEFQIEGACYLGMGVLILGAIAFIILVRDFIINEKNSTLISYIKHHPRRVSMVILCGILFVAAVFPTAAFSDRLIFTVPLPDIVKQMLGTFRSNGRFIWPAVYIILFCIAGNIAKLSGKKKYNAVLIMLLFICVTVHLLDFEPWIKYKNEHYYEAQQSYRTIWDEIELLEGYSRFVSFEENHSILMQTAYYALRHHMTVNRFYFARDIEEILSEADEKVKDMLMHEYAAADADTLYVFDRDSYEDMKDCGLYFYPTRKCIFGVKNKIEGMKELEAADIENIAFR